MVAVLSSLVDLVTASKLVTIFLLLLLLQDCRADGVASTDQITHSDVSAFFRPLKIFTPGLCSDATGGFYLWPHQGHQRRPIDSVGMECKIKGIWCA